MSFNLKSAEWALIASGFITIAVVAWFESSANGHWDLGRAALYGLYVASFLFSCFLPRALPHYILQVNTLILAVIAGVIFVGFPWPPSFVLLVVLAAMLAEAFGKRSWWVLIGINVFFLMWDQFYNQDPMPLLSIGMFFGFQLFAASSSHSRLESRDAKEELEQLNLELRAAQALLGQQSQQQERLRISRDLHDSIGHRLTALSLQLEHAKHKAPSDINQWRDDLALSVRDTLAELRQIVRAMRNDVAIDLSLVAKRLALSLPQSVELSYPDSLNINNPDLAQELVFCLQESISNALRHGKASKIELKKVNDEPLTIAISDNGQSKYNWQTGSGLKGMRERLAPFGGSAELKPLNSGGMVLSLVIEGAENA